MDAQLKKIFHISSFLLTYPDRHWWDGLEDCKNEINTLDDHQDAKELFLQFFSQLEQIEPIKWIESYVYLIDFGRNTNFYLTHGNDGQQRERGIELLALKNLYSNAGFVVTDQELPDYVPLILEFLSFAQNDYVLPIIEKFKANFLQLEKQFIEKKHGYQLIFKIINLSIQKFEDD
ncbi:nitrate reductase molybdenum cofactor assembly chaperone [Heyndrickxia sp. FSL W8-0496]|uniref:nitrate reductase molybdenum cofactor assembly chaperone n=1 Tax=Heyndrickxia TaxID=2837504 RepID=UPI0030F676A8